MAKKKGFSFQVIMLKGIIIKVINQKHFVQGVIISVWFALFQTCKMS